MYQATFYEILFCLIFWIIAAFIYLPSLRTTGRGFERTHRPNSSQLFGLFFIITLYSVFEFAGGDFFHYKEFYERTHFLGTNDGLDPIYLWLIDVLPNNFYLWRLVVWGAASFIWIQIIKRLGYSVRLAGCLFLLIVFFLFVGARQALGFSLLYLGVTMMLNSTKIKEKLLGILIFLSAYFFHSTMIVYMLLSILALVPVKRRTIIISLIMFPILYKIFDAFIEFFIVKFSLFNDDSADTMVRYLESDFRAKSNINGLIRRVIDRLPIFILLFVSIKDIWKNKIHLPKIYHYFLMMTYILIYISYLFIGREVSAYIAPRFWDAALFPLTLFLGGYLTNKKANLTIYVAVAFLVFSKLFTYFLVFTKI